MLKYNLPAGPLDPAAAAAGTCWHPMPAARLGGSLGGSALAVARTDYTCCLAAASYPAAADRTRTAAGCTCHRAAALACPGPIAAFPCLEPTAVVAAVAVEAVAVVAAGATIPSSPLCLRVLAEGAAAAAATAAGVAVVLATGPVLATAAAAVPSVPATAAAGPAAATAASAGADTADSCQHPAADPSLVGAAVEGPDPTLACSVDLLAVASRVVRSLAVVAVALLAKEGELHHFVALLLVLAAMLYQT